MSLIKGFVMSLGMFSIIPVSPNSWDNKYMPLVVPSLPLVGLLIGLIWYGLALLSLSLPMPIQSVIVLFVPFILSGFIHADGYMDTADAVFSRRGLEEKKRILKDPNTGAFAVIAIVGVILFQFSTVQAIVDAQISTLVFIFIPAISRCVAGVAVLNLKPFFEAGYYVSLRNGAKICHTVFICVFAALLLLIAWFMPGVSAWPLLTAILVGILITVYLYKQFGGMSGDLCGCIITVGEFAALLCLALV